MAKKVIVRQEKRGCLWWCGAMLLACVAIAALAYAACIAAGVGLWFLVRYCWRRLSEQAPDSKFVQKMRSVPPIARQVGAGLACAVFSLALMGGLSGAASARSGATSTQAPQTTQTQQQADSADDAKKTADEAPATEPDSGLATGQTEPDSGDRLSNLVVRFLDVGQGDASLVEFPDGKTMLIDTPTGESSTVTSALAADGRGSIDWLVATHPDADHIGGLDGVIGAVEVGSVWAPEVNSPTQTYTRFLTAVANKGLVIEPAYAGRRIAEGDSYTVDIPWPQQGVTYGEDNSYSAILKVAYGENTFLFTGDAPVEAQDEAVDGHVDALKVSHHGSASGLNAALAAKLSPTIAVLSYGKNSYGHPTQVVLDALAAASARVLGTYVNGTVTVTSDGRDVSASAEREGDVAAASQDAGASSQGLGGTGDDGSGAVERPGSGDVGSGPGTSAQDQAATSADADETVVVTPKGKKYHLPDCRTLSRSKNLTELTKAQAQSQGYGPCGVCNP